jgi:hypothetical protein
MIVIVFIWKLTWSCSNSIENSNLIGFETLNTGEAGEQLMSALTHPKGKIKSFPFLSSYLAIILGYF